MSDDYTQVLTDLAEIKSLIKNHVEATNLWKATHLEASKLWQLQSSELVGQHSREIWGTDQKSGIKTDVDRMKIQLKNVKLLSTTISVTILGIIIERLSHLFIAR